MANDSAEYLVEVDDEAMTGGVLDDVEVAGGRVRHRYGKVVIVEIPAAAEATLRGRLPAGARLLAARELPSEAAPAGETVEAIGHAAARLRQSPEFRRSKAARTNEGKEWGSGGLPEPDIGEDDDDMDQVRRAHRPPGGQP